jgi:hypothetical protein
MTHPDPAADASTGATDVAISHPEKVLFPDSGTTKGELCAYYQSIAPLMLPHVRGRPVTMERYPAGIDKKGFIQGKEGGVVHYPLANEARALVCSRTRTRSRRTSAARARPRSLRPMSASSISIPPRTIPEGRRCARPASRPRTTRDPRHAAAPQRTPASMLLATPPSRPQHPRPCPLAPVTRRPAPQR